MRAQRWLWQYLYRQDLPAALKRGLTCGNQFAAEGREWKATDVR